MGTPETFALKDITAQRVLLGHKRALLGLMAHRPDWTLSTAAPTVPRGGIVDLWDCRVQVASAPLVTTVDPSRQSPALTGKPLEISAPRVITVLWEHLSPSRARLDGMCRTLGDIA